MPKKDPTVEINTYKGSLVFQTAAMALGVSSPDMLDPDCLEYLDRVASSVWRAGGDLVSRQAIAVAVRAWEEAHNRSAKLG